MSEAITTMTTMTTCKRIFRISGAGALVALFLGLLAAPAGAQVWTWSSAAETGGDDVTLLYTQLSVHPDRLGLMPVASVSTYWLGSPGSDTWAITPAVGLRYRASEGFFTANVGYSFKTADDPFPFFGGRDDGVTTSGHAEHWGTGQVGLQGIASYNWGSEYLWSRARATFRVADLRPGSVHIGGEYVWQGELEEEDALLGSTKYQARQYGPVIQWMSGRGHIVALSGGWKDTSFEDTGYVKLEVTLNP